MARPSPRIAPGTGLIDWLLSLPLDLRARAVAALGPDDSLTIDRDWPSWAHAGQLAPPPLVDGTPWRTWLMMAGRGFGKTRAGAEWIAAAARDGAARIALVAASLEEARAVMVEGVSGLLRVAAGDIAGWRPSLGLLTFRSGAEARLFSGASPEGLRGPEHSHAWCDELAKWPRGAAAWDNLQLGLRLGPSPQALVTTTPRVASALEAILAAPDTVVSGGPTAANPHLPTAFVAAMTRHYGGTRLAEQELEGRMPAAREGALWTRAMLEARRVQGRDCAAIASRHEEPRHRAASGRPEVDPSDVTNLRRDGPLPPPFPTYTNALSWTPPPPAAPPPRRFTRLAIGLDPPAGGGTCGIVACALDGAGMAYVLEDASLAGARPEGWAAAAADCWRRWAGAADSAVVVAEVNQGGEMVRAVLRTAAPTMPVRTVRATDGKARRAEPVALLFEQGRVRLCGRFEALEAELLRFVAGGAVEGASPDRADAMVWALSELTLRGRAEPRVVGL